MKIVITGGAGFIGSHLSKKFVNEGFEVIAVDNLVTGRESNISDILTRKNFKFLKVNVSEKNFFEILKRESEQKKVDIILHFASPASVKDYLNLPFDTMKTSSFGTYNILEFAKEEKARVIFSSTSEVYGNPQVSPQTEDYWGNVNPVGPRAVYDESKRFSEAMCTAYHRYCNIDIRIIRIFNTYGPYMREDDGRVIPNFITQSLLNKPITIYGDGTQTRSFLYIEDLVTAVYKLTLSENMAGVILNVGMPKEIKILELGEIVKRVLKSKSEFVFEKLPEDDPKRRIPNIDKIKKLLGWEPKVELEDGIKETAEHFKRILKK